MVLMRTDPFRELERLSRQMSETAPRPVAMSMDAFRAGDAFVVELDLPGVDPESIDLNVEQGVLSVRADRRTTACAEDSDVLIAERSSGTFSRQLFLGETLDVAVLRLPTRPGCCG